MTLNPVASQQEPDSADTQEFVRMINDARMNGMSQASGAGFKIDPAVLTLDRDDQSNPDQAIIDNPQLGSIDMLAAAASFGVVVPGSVQAAYANHFRAVELRGVGSLTNGGGSLEDEFRAMFDEVDENGRKKDKEKDWDSYVEAQERIREDRQRMEADINATLSQSEIDAMAWEGNINDVWTSGSIKASRASLYNGLSNLRKKPNLDKLDEDNNWTDAERAHEERLISDAQRALKNDDQYAYQEAIKGMKPETLDEFKQIMSRGVERDASVSIENASASVSQNVDTNSTVENRTAAVLQAAENAVEELEVSVNQSEVPNNPRKESSLSNPPTPLTPGYNQAASGVTADRPATELASVIAPVKPAQTFDI